MRVCMLTYSFYEDDIRVSRYGEAAAARGDEVDVIALRRDGREESGVVNGVQVYRIQTRRVDEKRQLDYLLRITVFFFRAMFVLIRRQLRSPYQIIHVHSVPDYLVFAAWFPRLLGAKVILDIHDLLPELYSSKFRVASDSWICRILLFVERASATFAHHVITANHLWQEKLVRRSSPVEKITVLLNFPNRSIFRPAPCRARSGKQIILYPGSLNWHQGLDIAVRAFARIHKEFPDAEFHIYGEGPMHHSLACLAKELGLGDRFVLEGFRPIQQVVAAMQTATLGVVPKRKDAFGNEAFSTKILEFMAVGVPVLVSDTRIDRHYFNDQVVRFFRSGDDGDLAEQMRLLLENSDVREQMIGNALEFVEDFSWETHKGIYLRLIDSLRSGCTVAKQAPGSHTVQ